MIHQEWRSPFSILYPLFLFGILLLAGCAPTATVAPNPTLPSGTSELVLNPPPGAICGDEGCRVAPTLAPGALIPTLAATPFVRLPADDRALGAIDAPVTLIEYSDYQCPFCRVFARANLHELENKYVKSGKLRIIWRDFPLPSHHSAVRAAHAAHCAAEQGKYWEMHDRLFADADKFSDSHDADFELFRAHARELRLNVEQYMTCMESRKYLERITEDVINGRALGIDATPAYVLNGELLRGLYPASTWERMIEARLKSH